MTRFEPLQPPEHGGRLQAAAERWGIPREQWLDLSTGINPVPWPVPDIPPEVWQRLPEPDDGLEYIIRDWAGAPETACCLPVSGSQAAIMALPAVRARCYGPGRVAVPMPGYREHGHAWRRAGFEVVAIPPDAMESGDLAWLDTVDVVVWIQPNNPTGQVLAAEQLMAWHQRLQLRAGWLVVDEAFLMNGADQSLAARAGMPGLMVLKSTGKFFGLAGLRAGAIVADAGLIQAVSMELGPWSVSGPARYLMGKMLNDHHWQQQALQALRYSSQRLHGLLSGAGLGKSSGTLLFRYLRHPNAVDIRHQLARQGILIRLFERPSAIRLGLPGTESDWLRLQQALETVGRNTGGWP
ncbi:threonine-phosphate decarboxylase [Marinobacter fuscus]|uniref:threonine-phosphate decarboxylase n=1 Tax=Marinobacter fuscus TaxID=2109942 RepID=A0A2T1KUI1_9GAMM|nr:threonine-phosphate decarboxylase CobD [Marinobacter fuscus]PSF13362.1 threonine-phosphate decarboxylase [Marinobacter fuscus]